MALAREQPAKALEILARVRKLDPRKVQTYLMQSALESQQKKPDAAAAALEAGMAANPQAMALYAARARLAEQQQQYEQAEEFLKRAAEHERTATPPLTGDMVFHARQLVEKSLKAFLSRHNQPFRKTHDLVELGWQGSLLHTDLEPLLQEAAPLTEYAWKFRYPGEEEEPPWRRPTPRWPWPGEFFRPFLTSCLMR